MAGPLLQETSVALAQGALLTEVPVAVLNLDLIFDDVVVALPLLRIVGELALTDQDLL